MNLYVELQMKQQKAFNTFSRDNMFFAFNNDQLQDGLKKLGVTGDDVANTGAGGYVLKSKIGALNRLMEDSAAELAAAIQGDKTGDGFIYDMFYHELNNHEYIITGDIDDTLDALAITRDDLDKNPALTAGLKKACAAILAPGLPLIETTGDPDLTPDSLTLSEWHPENLNGYEPKTTFWHDFSIADNFGLDAVRKTYNRAVNEWHDDHEYITELILVLNHKCWQWYEKNAGLSALYSKLYDMLDVWARDTFDDEQKRYLFDVTN